MRNLLIFLFVTVATVSNAQDSVRLSLREVLDMATQNHPIVRQAGLQDKFAAAELLAAKGKFDPKLQSSYIKKEYLDKPYYSKFYSAVKFPTWLPVDPKIELYKNQGDKLNPQDYIGSTTNNWQVAAGISLPIGKGLFIDERRSMVQQAKLFGDIAEAEKIKLTNKTLFSIVKVYWDWYFAYEQFELQQKSMKISEEIVRRTKLDFGFGEASALDTIQAEITFQSRLVDFEKAKLELVEARLALSVHLWSADGQPLELKESTTPASEDNSLWMIPSDSSLSFLTQWTMNNHPEILKIQAKKNQLDVQEKWNKESLKPEINLNYSMIDTPFKINGYTSPALHENYKLGMDVSFPILLRKERGSLQKTKAYIESISFDLLQTQQELEALLSATYASIKTNQTLVAQYLQLAKNYEALMEAEIFNLESGESDLFKLNIQQDKYIQSQLKYLEAQVKLEKLKVQLPYHAGLPELSYNYLYE